MALFRRSKPMDPAEIEGMKAEITSLRATLDRHDARPVAPDPSPRLDELATRVANLDSLDRRPNGNGVTPDVVGELRDGQVRLANEQARYQIAFREDLARLAEQLRRA